MEGMDHIIPDNYKRPEAMIVPVRPQIMEAITLPGGRMTMRFHHFDARELPLVSLNTKRNFFLAKCLTDETGNHLSTDLDYILGGVR